MDKKLDDLHNFYIVQSRSYKTDHLLSTYGDDFEFGNAFINYRNIDNVIKHFNEKYDDFQLKYSTPSQYVDAVRSTGTNFTVYSDDLFPYANNNISFWTGYFTSRANLKEYARKGSSLYRGWNKLGLMNFINYPDNQKG